MWWLRHADEWPNALIRREFPSARRALHIVDAVEWARDALGFEADPVQRQVLNPRIQQGILNCSRQWGKSTVTAVKALHRAVHFPGSLVVVASPSARQSGEFVRKAAVFLPLLGLKRRGDGMNAASLEFPNGSRIVGLPGNADTVRGFSGVALLIVDEAARVRDEVWEAVTPMQAASGPDAALWLMSTPKGKRGFFWREWSGGSEEWTRIQVTALECPRIRPEFLAKERRRRSEAFFRQEYLCDFRESRESLFREADVEAALWLDLPPLLDRRGRLR